MALFLQAFMHHLDAGNEFKHGGIRPKFKLKVIKEQPAKKSLNRSSLEKRHPESQSTRFILAILSLTTNYFTTHVAQVSLFKWD